VDKTKPFVVSKQGRVAGLPEGKANAGAAGIDGQSLAQFEQDRENNLYKLWNRLSSGSYFPPPVMLVEIPKKGGGVRPLGVPTVADRIAQTVVVQELDKVVEAIFDDDSYGYRPGRSAHDAPAVCRERCWRCDWAVDLDVKSSSTRSIISCCSRPWPTTPTSAGSCCTCNGGCNPRCSSRRQSGRAGPGQPARVGDLTCAGGFVSALRVRRLDAADLPVGPVRTLRR
jgi:hypothetical protein